MIFRKDGPLEEQVGGVILCAPACLGAVFASRLLLCDYNQSSLVDGTLRKGS